MCGGSSLSSFSWSYIKNAVQEQVTSWIGKVIEERKAVVFIDYACRMVDLTFMHAYGGFSRSYCFVVCGRLCAGIYYAGQLI